MSGRQTAPGLDGLPYAAYRAAPIAASRVLAQRLHDYINLQAPAPVQALVFIPKADAGPYADNFRPLGLPNTADRIIDQAVYVRMYTALRRSLHPSQTLINIVFREPQGNFLDMQSCLRDRSAPYFVLLSDLAKAFERVNPHWILLVLQRLGTPVWAYQYATYVLFGRYHLFLSDRELIWGVRSQSSCFVCDDLAFCAAKGTTACIEIPFTKVWGRSYLQKGHRSDHDQADMLAFQATIDIKSENEILAASGIEGLYAMAREADGRPWGLTVSSG